MGSRTCIKVLEMRIPSFKSVGGIFSNVKILFLLSPHTIHSQREGSNSHFNYKNQGGYLLAQISGQAKGK